MNRIAITINVPDGLKNVPVEVEISPEAGFNPASSFVTDERGVRLPFILSDSFLYADSGTLTFLAAESSIKTYHFHYSFGGPRAMPAYAGPVGCGDCLRTAPDSVHPLFQGMSAQGFFADIDHDGQDELIAAQIYSSVIRRPWHIINAYKAVDGIYGDAVPLRVSYPDGRIDYLHGASHAEYRDGFLYSCGYGAPEGIGVYRTTGSYTLEYAGSIALPNADGQITAFRLTDSGIYAAVSRTVYGITPDDLWFAATEEEIRNADWPRWNAEAELLFYAWDTAPYTIRPPVPVGIRAHMHFYFDIDRATGGHLRLHVQRGPFRRRIASCGTDRAFPKAGRHGL